VCAVLALFLGGLVSGDHGDITGFALLAVFASGAVVFVVVLARRRRRRASV
jgi:hypothetical protein